MLCHPIFATDLTILKAAQVKTRRTKFLYNFRRSFILRTFFSEKHNKHEWFNENETTKSRKIVLYSEKC
jgi:hypothetical protein